MVVKWLVGFIKILLANFNHLIFSLHQQLYHPTTNKKTMPAIAKAMTGIVEVRGVEPLSKHILQKSSTCLLTYYLSGENRKITNQFFP